MTPQRKQEIKDKFKAADDTWNAWKDKIFFIMLTALLGIAGRTYIEFGDSKVVDAVQQQQINELERRITIMELQERAKRLTALINDSIRFDEQIQQ